MIMMDNPRNIGGGRSICRKMDAEDHDNHDDQDVEVPLPGFRFHPTDEELVGFYLRRKKRLVPQEIKSATGIDKPVHSHGGDYGKNNQCIGLKKTLVYYRGSAGKGTKTDWMMHEFRLPTINDIHTSPTTNLHPANTPNSKPDPKEAEIWTLCRIFKRNMSYRKYTPDWRELSTNKRQPTDTISSKKCNSLESNNNNIIINREANYNYIDFSAPAMHYRDQLVEKKPVLNHTITNGSQLHDGPQLSSTASHNLADNVPHSMDAISNFSPYSDENDQFFTHTSWDELSAVVELALDPALM
ncbi:hypothetical protein TIFTF001_025651 [Ficus carica]|uniref:NAC domain-containing protein n=1 Tax=Ficus carica TaxID=3494 RepID=A0AA88AJB2_FICCA|nr:hypothetical protein TIFTF001_025651 [Ficus carica]